MLLLLLVGGQSLLASGSSLRQEVKALAGGSVALRYRILSTVYRISCSHSPVLPLTNNSDIAYRSRLQLAL